jgi:hypothetical protein
MQAKLRAIFVLGVVLVSSTGCARQAEPAARNAAVDFANAVANHNGSGACALLAPATKSSFEQSEDKKCAIAILQANLPPAGGFKSFASYGTMAQAKFAGDVEFVAEFKGGWRIMAAGCSAVPGHPYDCQLEGG